MPIDNFKSEESFLENRHTSPEPAFSGRKGIAYDWQQLLIPSETVFEASLETMLSAIDAGDHMSPTASK